MLPNDNSQLTGTVFFFFYIARENKTRGRHLPVMTRRRSRVNAVASTSACRSSANVFQYTQLSNFTVLFKYPYNFIYTILIHYLICNTSHIPIYYFISLLLNYWIIIICFNTLRHPCPSSGVHLFDILLHFIHLIYFIPLVNISFII